MMRPYVPNVCGTGWTYYGARPNQPINDFPFPYQQATVITIATVVIFIARFFIIGRFQSKHLQKLRGVA
jgi:hypothetical protein